MHAHTHERQQAIKRAVSNITTSTPDTDGPGFWHIPGRDCPDYYRFVIEDEDDELVPTYDVYLEKEVARDKVGVLHVSLTVVCFNVEAWHDVDRTEIFTGAFDGHQPSEQAFLNNIYHYKRQIKEQITAYAESVQYWATSDS